MREDEEEVEMILTVRDLRRRWKPTKERLSEEGSAESLRIRIHRACSWLDRAEKLGPEDVDGRLIFSWVALNSLYSVWDAEKAEPKGDRVTLEAFLDSLLELDVDGYLPELLEASRPLVSSILDDEYVSKYYWEAPGPRQARAAKSTRRKANTWYFEKNYTLILLRVIERVYFLRCQLVHGAATCGSKHNRESLARCVSFMRPFLLATLTVLVDYGVEKNWDGLCYPPIDA